MTVPFTIRVSAKPGAGTIKPPTMTEDGMALTDDDAEVDPDETPRTAGVKLKATAFGYREDDTRLVSITIVTLPDPEEGRLVLLQGDDDDTGVPVTAGQVITKEDLDACNLVLVANTKDDAMISFTFTSDGTTEDNDITPAIPSTLTIGGNDDTPVVA